MADLKDTFSKGLTTINVKASTFLEANKIKAYIATVNQEIEALKTEIGDLVYCEWCQTQTISEENLQEKLAEIRKKENIIQEQTELARELSEKEKRILGGTPSASQGGMSVEGTAAACVCPNCGQQYETPVKFCRKCGTKLI